MNYTKLVDSKVGDKSVYIQFNGWFMSSKVTRKMEQNHPLLLLSLLVLSVFYLVFKRKFSKYPPGPFPLPIIGNYLHFRNRRPHAVLAYLAKLHGPIMTVKFGTRPVIIASSHSVATAILKNHNQQMSGRPDQQTFHGVYGKDFQLPTIVGATECTDNWKMLRNIMKTELLPAAAMDSRAILREQKMEELIDFLRSKEGKVVKIGELVFNTAANIVSKLFFSVDLIDLNDEGKAGGVKQNMRKIERLAGTINLGDLFPILSGRDVQGLGKKFREYSFKFFASWESFVDERLARNDCEEKDFLDVLLARGFSKNQINWFLSELFITSIDTSGAAIEWAMSELLKNKEAMSKLREELAREIHGNMVHDSDLRRLPYLNACVKETLRLRPSVAILLRRAIETCKVMNYTIPKGTYVWVNLWALGRDPTRWEDPLAFKPSRFLESNLDFMGYNYEYLPFGTGKRMCPGLPLAARMVPLVIATLVHSFDWHLPDNRSPDELDMNEKMGITLQRENPLLLIPKFKHL